MNRLRKLGVAAVVLAALVAPAAVPRAVAYEGDHYFWTYYLALHVGFTRRQAFQIASGTYALDFDPNLSPMEATAGDAFFGANHAALGLFGKKHPALANKWRDFHAFADEKLVEGCVWQKHRENPEHQCLATIMSPQPMNAPYDGRDLPACPDAVAARVAGMRETRRRELFQMALDQRNPGVLIHFAQDYYAHFQFDTFHGHFLAAHLPDHLAFSTAKAQCATRDTIQALIDFRDSLGPFDPPEGSRYLRQRRRQPDMQRILTVLARLVQANPIMGSWNPLESPSNLAVGGPDAAVPSPGRSLLVVEDAIREDEEAGRLPRWPRQREPGELVPYKFHRYVYDEEGRILEQPEPAETDSFAKRPMPGPVERVALALEPRDPFIVSRGDIMRIRLEAMYEISGIAPMSDYDGKPYLTPLPIIESERLSDEPSANETERRFQDGIYTIQRDVERPRVAVESGALSWKVAVQLYGYEPKEVTIVIGGGGEEVAQPSGDLCSWLPAGPLETVGETTLDPITEIDDGDRSVGIVAKCVKGYADPKNLTLAVYLFDSPSKAGRLFSRAAAPYLERRPSPYGDENAEEWELGQSEGSSRYYGLAFRRGCHQFQASTRLLFGDQIPAGWDPVPTATIDAIRRAAAQVDANAKVSPGCGG